jgi:energy-coupling factor transporter ATP-binding protein EcfA2
MNSNKATSYDSTSADFQPEHLAEFKASAIASDIADRNFRSFDGEDENEREEAFLLVKDDPQHNNNGTLSGTSQNDLANTLYSGCWAFQGHKGVCVKPNSPRKNKDGKVIKYESPRGAGNQQLFIPHVTARLAILIDSNVRYLVPEDRRLPEYVPLLNERNAIDTNFWDWFATTPYPLIITEGAKKVCSVVSAGFPSIALNGIWGWGSNVKNEDGTNKEPIEKLLHPDLLPFLNGREIILAFDIDENEKTKTDVAKAKNSFCKWVKGKVDKVTEIKWNFDKGIDDCLANQPEDRRKLKLDVLVEDRSEIGKSGAKPKSEATTGKQGAEGEDKPQNGDEPGGKSESAGERALRLAKAGVYFHTDEKVAYADIWIDGNRHTYAVRSRAFRLWLTGAFYRDAKSGLSPQVLADLFPTLEAIAICDGETREVQLRTAEHQGKIYIDLGADDWKAIEVDAVGWRVVSEPPIRFWRPESLLPLPAPIEGGSLDELKELLNVDRQSWVMIATFLLFCFCPNKTYPVLVLAAHRGSGKTAAAEILKGLIDPGKAGLIKLQNDTHKLAIAATRRHLMVYDNVGHISPDQSDDLCRIATGFGYSTRTLFSTDEETTFEFTRPQIITAIDALVTRDDLADRVLMAQLPEIPEDKRLSQSELNEKVESSRPRILGALLTALSQALAEISHIKPEKLPRMADYALFAIASEKALGLKVGEFMATFNESREQSRQVVIESSPVGEAIIRLMEKTQLVWKGTASELLNELEKHTDEATYRSRYFPKASNMLTRQLNRLAPDLKALGIEVSFMRQGVESKKVICLEKGLKTSPSQDNASHGGGRVATEHEF